MIVLMGLQYNEHGNHWTSSVVFIKLALVPLCVLVFNSCGATICMGIATLDLHAAAVYGRLIQIRCLLHCYVRVTILRDTLDSKIRRNTEV